jgi:hypothetical protein
MRALMMTSVLSAILVGIVGSSSGQTEPEWIAALLLVFVAAAALIARLADDGTRSARRSDPARWPGTLFIVFVAFTVAPMALLLAAVLLFTLPPVLYLLFPLFRLWRPDEGEDAALEAAPLAPPRRPSGRTATA